MKRFVFAIFTILVSNTAFGRSELTLCSDFVDPRTNSANAYSDDGLGSRVSAYKRSDTTQSVTTKKTYICDVEMSDRSVRTERIVFLAPKECLWQIGLVCNDGTDLKYRTPRDCETNEEIQAWNNVTGEFNRTVLDNYEWGKDSDGFDCPKKTARYKQRLGVDPNNRTGCTPTYCHQQLPHMTEYECEMPYGEIVGICVATACERGYHVEDKKCVSDSSSGTSTTRSAPNSSSTANSCLNRLTIGGPESPCKSGYTYKVCSIPSRNLSGECTGSDMLPSHATAGECSGAGRNGYSICIATACDTGYTPKGGLCKKGGGTSQPNNTTPTPPSATPPMNNDSKICGTTISKVDNNSQSDDQVVGGVEITVGAKSCTPSDEQTGKFDCGPLSDDNMNSDVIFKKEGFLEKTLKGSNFKDKNCPRITLTKDPNYTDPTGQPQVVIIEPETPDPTVRLKSMCEKSGGVFENNTCVCSQEKFLTQTTVTDTEDDNKEITICKCIPGYKRDTGMYDGKCIDAGEYEEKEVLDTAAMSQAAESIYKDEFNNEQSLANKILTSGTTLATGEGAMAAFQAGAEQRADAAAERDMTAYLETFRCEYAGGKTYKGGTEEITLPGGNELTEYYKEYKKLADKVKESKAALGLRPGIETEVLYERAQTGLYQYASTGITGGAYTSLSRALLDPEGKDATNWNQQKADTAAQLKKGKETFTTGIIAGVAGNYLINGHRQRQELKEEYKKVQNRLENEHSQVFTPDGMPPAQEAIVYEEDPVIIDPVQANRVEGYTRNIYGTAFDFAKFTLNKEGKEGLDAYIREVNGILSQPKFAQAKVEISTFGHTDKTPVSRNNRSYKTNTELSQKRAETVLNYLRDNFNNDRVHFGTSGGDGEQWCIDHSDKTPAECRHVEVILKDTTEGTLYL